MTAALTKLIAEARAARDENGVAHMPSKFIAKLIRERLKAEFPKQKFSIRSEYNSVTISYTDGPAYTTVNAICRQFSFGGFDGMIDLAYSSDNWLYPDGTMSTASCEGTEGSMGTKAAIRTDCPVPGAFIIDAPTKYVSVNRDWSDDRVIELCTAWEAKTGIAVTDKTKPWNQYVPEHCEWLSTLLHRQEEDLLNGPSGIADEAYILTAEHYIAE